MLIRITALHGWLQDYILEIKQCAGQEQIKGFPKIVSLVIISITTKQITLPQGIPRLSLGIQNTWPMEQAG